jgi:hypothetical protein
VTLRYIHLAPGRIRAAIAVLDRFGKKSRQISQQLLKSHLIACHKLLTNNYGGVGLLVWPLDFKSPERGFSKPKWDVESPFLLGCYTQKRSCIERCLHVQFCATVSHLYSHLVGRAQYANV